MSCFVCSYKGRRKSILQDENTASMQLAYARNWSVTCRHTWQDQRSRVICHLVPLLILHLAISVVGFCSILLGVLQTSVTWIIEHLHGHFGGRTSSSISVSKSSITLHADRAELLPGQVDGVVVLLSETLLSVLEIRPSTNVLQTLLRIPHRDQLLGLMKQDGACYYSHTCTS